MDELNFLGALAAGLVTLFVGAVWYAPPVFGNAWAKAAGLDAKPSRQRRLQAFVAGYLISVIVALGLSKILGPSPSLAYAVSTGLLVGGVLVGGSYALNHVFGGRPLRMAAIDAGYHAIQFAGFGAVLALVG
jgi:hypothetical protein